MVCLSCKKSLHGDLQNELIARKENNVKFNDTMKTMQFLINNDHCENYNKINYYINYNVTVFSDKKCNIWDRQKTQR